MANKELLLNLLNEAQEKMLEAIVLLEAYCKESGDTHTKAYILDHLKIMTSSQHGFYTRDPNLDGVMAEVEGSE